MPFKNKTRAFMSEDLNNQISDFKELVESTMKVTHSRYAFRNKELSDEKFQEEVIKDLRRNLTPTIGSLDSNISVWVRARGSTIKKYFKERIEFDKGFDPKWSLKIATRCNSQGGMNEVLNEDIWPWIDSVSTVLNKTQSKYLIDKHVVNKLKSMLEYPASVRETSIEEYVSEEGIETLMLNAGEKYLPYGANHLLNNGKTLKDIMIVTANVLEYKMVDEKKKDGFKTLRMEGRVKSSEALKWAKYLTGIRQERGFDGIGVLELSDSIDDLEKNVNQSVLLKVPRSHHHLEYRLPTGICNSLQGVNLKSAYAESERATMDLLKKTYMLSNNKISTQRVKHFNKKLIYGAWLDMNLRSNKSPIEVQFKDELGYLLYGFNSPFGHNSKAYNAHRVNELYKKVRVGNQEYFVDKITNYIANEVLMPAFTSKDRF